jgi:hypothetical protein
MAQQQPADSLADLISSLLTLMTHISGFEPKGWNSADDRPEFNSIFISHVHQIMEDIHLSPLLNPIPQIAPTFLS